MSKSKHHDLLGATVKDVHSPAGQFFYAPASFADLPDCPFCKFGTPMQRDGKMICIDCGAVLSDAENKPRKS